jgi:hypothetical protein
MKTLRNALLLTAIYVVLLLGIHFLHVRFFSVDVVFYAAMGDALLAAVLTGLLLLVPALRRFTLTEKVLLVMVSCTVGSQCSFSLRQRDVGAALHRVVHRQLGEHDLRLGAGQLDHLLGQREDGELRRVAEVDRARGTAPRAP